MRFVVFYVLGAESSKLCSIGQWFCHKSVCWGPFLSGRGLQLGGDTGAGLDWYQNRVVKFWFLVSPIRTTAGIFVTNVIVRPFCMVISVRSSLSSGLFIYVLYGCRFCLTKPTGKSHRDFPSLWKMLIMAAVICPETLEQPQHTERLNPESRRPGVSDTLPKKEILCMGLFDWSYSSYRV
jgi:hypothetical protein